MAETVHCPDEFLRERRSRVTCFLSHRGESDDAPENTLAAFRLAMQRDSDGIELDIRLTSDECVVCVHDETLKRVAGIPLPIGESTLADLRKHHPLPLLAEALDLLKPGKHMQIELKGNDKNLLPALKTVLEQWKGNKAQLALSSFEKETIQSAGVFFPELPRLLLTDLKTEFGSFPSAAQVSESMKSLNCTGVSFKADRSASREFVNQLHANGLRVVCWGVSSDELGIAMAELGVDAMTSNHAVALRRIWREKQS